MTYRVRVGRDMNVTPVVNDAGDIRLPTRQNIERMCEATGHPLPEGAYAAWRRAYRHTLKRARCTRTDRDMVYVRGAWDGLVLELTSGLLIVKYQHALRGREFIFAGLLQSFDTIENDQ